MARALLATALGLLLLSSGLGTWSSWSEQHSLPAAGLTAGSLTLTSGAWTIQLHSQQEAGTRTFASSTTCTVPSGFVECRDVTATFAGERLSSPEDTTAAWRETNSSSPGNAQFDTIALVATNTSTTAPDNQVITSAIAASEYAVSNVPSLTLRNTSARHDVWVDVVDTMALGSLNNNGDSNWNNILSDWRLDYVTTQPGQCLYAGPLYWDVLNMDATGMASPSQLKSYHGVTVPRTTGDKTNARIPAGGSVDVCPFLRPRFPTATQDGRRNLLLNWAGRDITVRTTVRAKSYTNGTWTSNQQVVTTVYRVPVPMATASSATCTTGTYGSVGWAWPTSNEASDTTTNAVRRWILMRQNPSTGVWSPFRKSQTQDPNTDIYSVGGNPRGIGTIYSDDVNNNDGNYSTGGASVRFMVRGYLTAAGDGRNPSGPYLNSNVVLTAREISDRWQCTGTAANAESGADSAGYHAS